MLGWPSPTYPSLLTPEGIIPITKDQSAMIAGMLMNGFVFSTPFAGCDCLGSKFGVLLGAALQLSGWLLILGASDVLGLCASRILIGVGTGYGMGKFKNYLKEICAPDEGAMLTKCLPIFICIGVIISFCVGPFVSFKTLAVVNSVTPGLCFLTFSVVPDTPLHLFQLQKVSNAVDVLRNIHGKECVDDEVEDIKHSLENKIEKRSIFQIIKNRYTRNSFITLIFLMTIQQFSGGPSLIVYNQIVFTEFKCLYPHLCSIVYAITFLISTGIGIKYVPNFRRKPVLLLSCLGCVLTSASHASYLYLKPENIYYTVIPFITMVMYAFFHTAGISSVTGLIVSDIFPTNARGTMMCVWNMYTAELAVIITKVFQVFYDRYDMYVGFCLYTTVSIFGLVVIMLFLTEPKEKLIRNRVM